MDLSIFLPEILKDEAFELIAWRATMKEREALRIMGPNVNVKRRSKGHQRAGQERLKNKKSSDMF